jgi:putative PIN family toxin of toxin-antitoxin system
VRVVLDTNVILSALVFPGGTPDQVLQRVRRREVDLFVSPFIIAELERILQGKFRYTSAEVRERVRSIRRMATLAEPAERLDLVKAKSDDNRILQCTVAAHADYLVTGDRQHLLPLRSVRGIPILAPVELLQRLDG